jgi:hypothetical protein
MTGDLNTEPASEGPRQTILWLAIGTGMLILALVFRVGSREFGLTLVDVGIGSLVMAVVHHWRRPRPFILLTVFSLIGIPLMSVLHNLFYALAQYNHDVPILGSSMRILNVASFIAALLVCPTAAVVGGVGSLVTLVRSRRRSA